MYTAEKVMGSKLAEDMKKQKERSEYLVSDRSVLHKRIVESKKIRRTSANTHAKIAVMCA